MFSAAIDALPDTSDPEFSGRANVILSGLRKLQTALTKAASRGRATPSVIVSLSGVRTRYDDLMAHGSRGARARRWASSSMSCGGARNSRRRKPRTARGSRPICSTPSRPRKSRPTTKRPGSRNSSRPWGLTPHGLARCVIAVSDAGDSRESLAGCAALLSSPSTALISVRAFLAIDWLHSSTADVRGAPRPRRHRRANRGRGRRAGQETSSRSPGSPEPTAGYLWCRAKTATIRPTRARCT